MQVTKNPADQFLQKHKSFGTSKPGNLRSQNKIHNILQQAYKIRSGL